MEFTKKYENGLKIVVKEMPGLYSLTVGFCVGVGSCLEDKSNNGFSHFIEHMFFKGTKSKNSFEIVEYVDGIGAQINAFTSKQTTCFYTLSIAAWNEVKTTKELCRELFATINF